MTSVLSLEGRYYNCHERAQRARDNYNIVTRVIQLISPRQSCDIENITWLRGNMKFISSVEQDISRVSEANE